MESWADVMDEEEVSGVQPIQAEPAREPEPVRPESPPRRSSRDANPGYGFARQDSRRDNRHDNRDNRSGYGRDRQGHGYRDRDRGDRDSYGRRSDYGFQGHRDSRQYDRRGSNRRGPQYTVEERRETGTIVNVRETFGFIECAEREMQLYFQVKDLVDQEHTPARGDEVEFDVVTDNFKGKMLARRLEVLPKGTVKFEEVLPDRIRGKVERQLQGYNSKQRGPEPFGGRIREFNPKADDEKAPLPLYEFCLRDVENPRVELCVGDEVEFSVFVEKRSGRKGATKVVLVRPNSADRAQGVVKSMRKDFGFIASLDTAEEIFFHVSEIVDQQTAHSVRAGDEFEFTIARDRENRTSCRRLVKLPRGTVKLHETVSVDVLATIQRIDRREPKRSKQKGWSQTPLFKGLVECTVTEDIAAKIAELMPSYEVKDGVVRAGFSFNSREQKFNSGDRVRCSLTANLATKAFSASDFVLEQMCQDNRKQGKVQKVSQNRDFGFISCFDRKDSLFFHVSALIDKEQEISEGMEVAYDEQEDPSGKCSAVRIEVLPKGTISFVESLPGSVDTVIDKPLQRKRRKPSESYFSKQPKRVDTGSVKVAKEALLQLIADHKDEAEALRPFIDEERLGGSYTFNHDNVSTGHSLLQGDRVSVSFKLLKMTKRVVVDKVDLVAPCGGERRTGALKDVTEKHAFIRLASSLPQTESIIVYQDAFIDQEAPYEDGVEVEFNVEERGRKKLSASRVVVLPAGSVQWPEPAATTTLRGVVANRGRHIITLDGLKAKADAKVAHIRAKEAKAAEQDSEQDSPDGSESVTPPPAETETETAEAAPEVKSEALHQVGWEPRQFPHIMKGDLVDFDFVLVEGKPTVVDVRLVPRAGRVEKPNKGPLCIRLLPPDVDHVPHVNEDMLVSRNCDIALQPGDEVLVSEVELARGRTTRGKRPKRVAKTIERTKEAPEGYVSKNTEQLQQQNEQARKNIRQKRGTQRAVTKQRLAKGPDETRGFGIGRGRPVEGLHKRLLDKAASKPVDVENKFGALQDEGEVNPDAYKDLEADED